MNISIRNLTQTIILILSLVLILISPVAAVKNPYQSFYDGNEIDHFNPYAEAGSNTCSSVSVSAGNLPPDAISKLKSEDIEGKAAQSVNNKRYHYAETETGVPWQIIAALHYREASMDPTKSIADGSSLNAGVSKDGVPINPDPNTDAANLANLLLNNASSVYGLDKGTVQSWTTENWGEALLAYNRGSMYKQQSKSYELSPYVMNYIDEDHIDMKWINADSFSNGTRLNGLEGKTETRLGALAIAAYLGLGSSSSGDNAGSSDNCGGPAGAAGDAAQKAIELSWPDRSHSMGDPNGAYIAAMKEVGLYSSNDCGPAGADCGVFVATVMRTSGVDKDFPTGTDIILAYLRDNALYTKIEATSTGDLAPGDIFIISGHTFMYVGNESSADGGQNMASASCDDRTADRGAEVYFVDTKGRGTYEIYRRS